MMLKNKILLFFAFYYFLTFKVLAQNENVEVKSIKIENTLAFYAEPKYATGIFAWESFIKNNLKYPPKAKKKNIQGIVIVKFQMSKNGKIRYLRILSKRLGYGLEKEAKRLVKLSEGGWWIAYDKNGKNISKSTTTHVKFYNDF